MMADHNSTVTVHALSAGSLTLPERYFVTPLEDPEARKTVPSLSFLIQHYSPALRKTTRIVFDLGIRKDLSAYAAPIYRHAMTRKPVTGDPDVISSLSAGNLGPEDIDFIILSHVHWDHIGTPTDFHTSKFVVGSGTRELLHGSSLSNGSHSHFEANLLPDERTIELRSAWTPPSPDFSDDDETSRLPRNTPERASRNLGAAIFDQEWSPLGIFPSTMDIFDDGSLILVSAPGHLSGHVNLLCRTQAHRYVYLAGDSCHDSRLLTGEKQVATWVDDANPAITCCIHADKPQAEKTLNIIRKVGSGKTEFGDVEIVFSHDPIWEKQARELGRFFPGSL